MQLRVARSVIFITALLLSVGAGAHDKDQNAECEGALGGEAKKAAATQPAKNRKWTLENFFSKDPSENLAIVHPFTIANAGERISALNKSAEPREAKDPLYRIRPTKIYPVLAGEDPATEGRMVVGQEEAIKSFVAFVDSIARGDRSGKALGFPGNAGTGKTELFYVFHFLQKNKGKEDKFKRLSYRWKGIYNIPYLRPLHKFMPDGKPMTEYFDPDMARSPFTLLREDMQKEILASVIPEIRKKWGMTISKGWMQPEPKSREIIRAIFHHEFKEIAEGEMSIDDLTREQYLATLQKYLVIVPHTLLRPTPAEPQFLRASSDNPNYASMFTAPNIERMAKYGQNSPFAVDYTGDVFRAEDSAGFLGIDELFRAQGPFLDISLELIQNRIVKVDYGEPVQLDVVPIWNSNDESIALAADNHAIKALLNRTEAPPMRSLLASNQIESVVFFQVGLDRFKMRKLEETEIKPFRHSEAYPAPDNNGRTYSAHGRYALYYDMEGTDILIAPYTMDYLAWFVSSTRFVTDRQVLSRWQDELNILSRNSELVANAISRVKLHLGDMQAKPTELLELSRIQGLAEEGTNGISARHIETWMKRALEIAKESGKGVLTPRMIDDAFHELMDTDKNFKPKDDVRATWMNLRERVKLELLLPKLADEVNAIVSGDGQQAERMYDQVERQMITVGTEEGAEEVHPEDGSQPILIDHEMLKEVRAIYFEKFHKEFSPTFLLRNLSNARAGSTNRDPELLEAIKIYIARKHVTVAEFITALDSFYRGKAKDPQIQKKAADIEPTLASFGYDSNSFREAVSFVAQLKIAEKRELERRKKAQQ